MGNLGAALGSQSFVESYVQCKVSQWTDTVRQLSDIARTQQHAAYSAFTCGLASQWSYLSRTIPGISDMLIPIDDAINTHFIPALTGHDSSVTFRGSFLHYRLTSVVSASPYHLRSRSLSIIHLSKCALLWLPSMYSKFPRTVLLLFSISSKKNRRLDSFDD